MRKKYQVTIWKLNHFKRQITVTVNYPRLWPVWLVLIFLWKCLNSKRWCTVNSYFCTREVSMLHSLLEKNLISYHAYMLHVIFFLKRKTFGHCFPTLNRISTNSWHLSLAKLYVILLVCLNVLCHLTVRKARGSDICAQGKIIIMFQSNSDCSVSSYDVQNFFLIWLEFFWMTESLSTRMPFMSKRLRRPSVEKTSKSLH